MNYFALALGIFAALIALYCLARLARAAFGALYFGSAWGFFLNAAVVTGVGTLAIYLFGMVA